MLQKLTNWLGGLIFTLKSRYWVKCNVYPLCILPYSHYKLSIDINQIVNEENCIIVRRSNKSEKDSFNDLDILREDIISEKDVPNLSMNLYGSKFTNEHLKYRCFGEAVNLWKGEKIKLSKYKTFYTVLETYSPIYFLIKDLHNKNFPYHRTNDKETQKFLKALNKVETIKDGKIKLNGTSNVIHTPNKLNYWHVELTIKDIQETEIRSTKSAWQKSAAEYAYKDIIVMSAKKIAPNNIYKIQNEVFLK